MIISDFLFVNLVNILKGNLIMIFKVFQVFILFLCRINVYDILYVCKKKNYFNFSFVLVRVYNDYIVLIYYVINDVNCFY